MRGTPGATCPPVCFTRTDTLSQLLLQTLNCVFELHDVRGDLWWLAADSITDHRCIGDRLRLEELVQLIHLMLQRLNTCLLQCAHTDHDSTNSRQSSQTHEHGDVAVTPPASRSLSVPSRAGHEAAPFPATGIWPQRMNQWREMGHRSPIPAADCRGAAAMRWW